MAKHKGSNAHQKQKYRDHFVKIMTTTSKGKTNKKHRKG